MTLPLFERANYTPALALLKCAAMGNSCGRNEAVLVPLGAHRRVAKCQNYTFDGVFRYKSSSMLIHLYIGCTLVYGWMTRLILLLEGILGHFNAKNHQKSMFLGISF